MQNLGTGTIVVLFGPSGSGKTTLLEALWRGNPELFCRLVTCTSRAKRHGEIDGYDYHFRDTHFFENNQGLILNNVSEEGHHYALDQAHLQVPQPYTLITLRRKGVLTLLRSHYNVAAVCLEISDSLREVRMRARGDAETDIQSRMNVKGNGVEAECLYDLEDQIPLCSVDSSLALETNQAAVVEFLATLRMSPTL